MLLGQQCGKRKGTATATAPKGQSPQGSGAQKVKPGDYAGEAKGYEEIRQRVGKAAIK